MQSLVAALLVWCFAVFVFDLIALGFFVSTKAPAAAQEIEFVCDATHVNSAVDIHSDFDNVADATNSPHNSEPGRVTRLAGHQPN